MRSDYAATRSPLVLKLMKRTINNGADMTRVAGLAYEASMISLALDSEDAHEGLGAFIAKRPAVFKGRWGDCAKARGAAGGKCQVGLKA